VRIIGSCEPQVIFISPDAKGQVR